MGRVYPRNTRIPQGGQCGVTMAGLFRRDKSLTKLWNDETKCLEISALAKVVATPSHLDQVSGSFAEHPGTKGPGIHKHIWGMEVVKKRSVTSELDVKGGIIMPCSVSGRKLHIKTRQCAITH